MTDTESPITEAAFESNPMSGAVQLCIRARVNGQRYVGYEYVPVDVWHGYGPDFQERLKDNLRQKLGLQLARDVEPLITVTLPEEEANHA